MSDSSSYNRLERSSPEEVRSGRVFAAALVLVLFAVAFPDLPPERLQGVLWTGLGLLMLAFPPQARVPAGWLWLAAGFVASACLGFLPRTWGSLSPWRSDLESLGLDTGSRIALQPLLAAETMAGFAVTAIAVVYLLGHRVNTRIHHGLMIAFSLGVAAIAMAAVTVHEPGHVFGFFPNRNHTGNLLVMGTMAGLAGLAQAIRFRSGWKIALCVIASACIIYALFTHNISRAGIVVLAAAITAWIALMGRRALGGHTGKAILLVVGAAIAVFLISDFQVKTRLEETAERIQAPLESAGDPVAVSFEEPTTVARIMTADSRSSIFEDALAMTRHEPWTGIGAGQFRYVSYQYRQKTTAPDTSITLHPESDWLWLVAEMGWLPAVFLAAALSWTGFHAIRRAWIGRGRVLRVGGIVAAFVVPFHGLFDVPGHRVGLAWAAGLLLALCLRPRTDPVSGEGEGPSRFGRLGWRGMAVLVMIGGWILLQADWKNEPVLASARVARLMGEAKSLYDADKAAYEQASAEGRDYQPPADQDPLEAALKKVEAALAITPLDPHLHYVRGAMGLHFDDKQETVDQAFAIQRRLLPGRADIPLEQAKAWGTKDPSRTQTLWQEALRREASVKKKVLVNHWKIGTFQQIMTVAASSKPLADAALPLAREDAERLRFWSRSVPAGLLDERMPELLLSPLAIHNKRELFQIWSKRGSKTTAEAFSLTHPELAEP